MLLRVVRENGEQELIAEILQLSRDFDALNIDGFVLGGDGVETDEESKVVSVPPGCFFLQFSPLVEVRYVWTFLSDC